ncbi:hypothetical protein AXG93_2772s1170 [Marchantia polymorpha subsp. ruderalis]|uniref:Uncharacterized protein n=1 Tax=Marchantia polymorpha subsp. ruderalis TaxID=1480154 RepID=A0A176WFJ3_MARPO|nr:hypothetical protein AXG93_2772s1170 [Marchantia polymorpha subsp. ruderalis]
MAPMASSPRSPDQQRPGGRNSMPQTVARSFFEGMDRSEPGPDRDSDSPQSGPSVVAEMRPAEAIGVECSEGPADAKSMRTFTYEVQHDTELFVYFNLLEDGRFSSCNFRAPVKAMKRHGLPTFERQQFTITAEQKKRFRTARSVGVSKLAISGYQGFASLTSRDLGKPPYEMKDLRVIFVLPFSPILVSFLEDGLSLDMRPGLHPFSKAVLISPDLHFSRIESTSMRVVAVNYAVKLQTSSRAERNFLLHDQ